MGCGAGVAIGWSREVGYWAHPGPRLQARFKHSCAIPGAADILKPALDPLMTSLGNLAKRPM